MFQLNEAPKMVLSALKANQFNRDCGTFWSIFCCIPTGGISIGWAQENQNASWLCCYPTSVNLESDVTLAVFEDKLKQIIISAKQIAKDSCFDERKFIEWQVKQTLALLNKALHDKVIKGSYYDTLTMVYKKILTQATYEEDFGKLLDTEQTPLTGTQPYTPHYGVFQK